MMKLKNILGITVVLMATVTLKPKPTMIVYESALGLYICKAVSVVITG